MNSVFPLRVQWWKIDGSEHATGRWTPPRGLHIGSGHINASVATIRNNVVTTAAATLTLYQHWRQIIQLSGAG